MNTTRRHPRTLNEAFGPYTSQHVEPMPSKTSRAERIADALFAITLGIVGCAILITWLAQ